MILLSVDKVSKSYSEKILLQDVSLYMNEGEKVGILGINGVGKSTLLRLAAGAESPDTGTVTRAGGIRVGYLPQRPDFDGELTVLQQVFKGVPDDVRELEEYEAKTILQRLGIADYDAKVGRMSGGEKKRVAIASALVTPCEVLILDEPTNHLDIQMIEWLESYLAKYTGALLMVTHDRYFLDRVTNRIVEIDRGALYSYSCNYSKYLEMKAQRAEMEQGTIRKERSLYRRELEWMQQGAKARGTKSRERIARFDALQQKVEPVAPVGKLEIASVASRLGKKTVEIRSLTKAFGEKQIIRDFEYTLLRDDRIGVVGRNGSGKSTLLKMIAGLEPPDSGSVVRGDTVKIGYFSQECEEMDPTLRVIDYIKSFAEQITTPEGTVTASQMLERFLFPSDTQWKPIGKISGGERRRLYLLRVLMEAPNVLLLDEPTNDLDIETMAVLETYLEGFPGAVIAVSHDRFFLDRVAEKYFVFMGGGEVKETLGGYAALLDAFSGEKEEPVLPTKKENNTEPRGEAPPRKLKFTFREQSDYDAIDGVIAGLEQKLHETEEAMKSKASDYVKLGELMAEKERLESELSRQMDRWVYLNDLAESIANQNRKD